MITTLFRIIKYGLLNFRRNVLQSIATINVMTLALIMFLGLIIFSVSTGAATEALKDQIDISVYFKTSAEEDEILKLRTSLESLEEVRSVEYVSREKALTVFQEKHKDDPKVSRGLELLDENPLRAHLNIKAHDTTRYEQIATYLDNERLELLIDEVSFTDLKLVIERLNRIVRAVRGLAFGLTIYLAVTTVIIVFITIRLAIHSNREEIGVMRLVGASNIFINGPYMVEAILFGLLAAVLSILAIAPLVQIMSPHIQEIADLDLQTYFFGNIFKLFLYQILFGVFLSTISAVIAIRRYLKV
jgi:cell division transport system permease protein